MSAGWPLIRYFIVTNQSKQVACICLISLCRFPIPLTSNKFFRCHQPTYELSCCSVVRLCYILRPRRAFFCAYQPKRCEQKEVDWKFTRFSRELCTLNCRFWFDHHRASQPPKEYWKGENGKWPWFGSCFPRQAQKLIPAVIPRHLLNSLLLLDWTFRA